MGKGIYGGEYGFFTGTVHAGNSVDGESGVIRRPITAANSYELPYDPRVEAVGCVPDNLYSRNGGSNQKYLQKNRLFRGADRIALCRQAKLPRFRGCFPRGFKAGIPSYLLLTINSSRSAFFRVLRDRRSSWKSGGSRRIRCKRIAERDAHIPVRGACFCR